jgi:hypothetical protein
MWFHSNCKVAQRRNHHNRLYRHPGCLLTKKLNSFMVLLYHFGTWQRSFLEGNVLATLHSSSPDLPRLRDELFTSYRTSTYRLHLYETLSGYKFVMLGDPVSDGLRRVMHQIYIGPFVEYVVRNPLATMDSKEQGIDNEYFRASVDRLVRGMPMFL